MLNVNSFGNHCRIPRNSVRHAPGTDKTNQTQQEAYNYAILTIPYGTRRGQTQNPKKKTKRQNTNRKKK